MILDCFTFFNEFDVLELRLRTLEAVVDRFVLCEAPFTFRGDPKPLYFSEEPERFARWRDRITCLTYTGPPSDDPWKNEWGQRDFLATALTDCAPDDLILIGDCDEIPDPRLVGYRPPEGGVLGHRMMLLAGYVNRLHGEGFCWTGTRALRFGSLARYGTLSAVRTAPHAEIETVDGGWHFTALGGAEVMERKMRAYSHSERDIPYFRDRNRLEVEYSSGERTWVPLDDRFPRPLIEDERWSRFVFKGTPVLDDTKSQRMEHAHGCFAYARPDSRAVAVIAADAGVWREVGEARFGTAFAGVFPDARSLPQLPPGSCVVIDRLGRQPSGTLSSLADAGPEVVAFAENARSYEVFQRVLSGNGAFPNGRPLGRAEYRDEIGAAGYRIAAVDRIFTTRVVIPPQDPSGYGVFLGSFVFPNMTRDGLLDFLSEAFVFTLALAPVGAAA